MPKSGSRTSRILHTMHVSGYGFVCEESNRQFKFHNKSTFEKMFRLHCNRCETCSKCEILNYATKVDKKQTAQKMLQSNNCIDMKLKKVDKKPNCSKNASI